MSIRPSYGRRSVLQVLSDGMSQRPPTGKSCCEEAAQSAAEVDRLTRERDELHGYIAEYWEMWDRQLRRADCAETDLDLMREWLEEAKAKHYALQAKLDAAENRPTLDREAVEAAIARWLAEPSEGDDDAAPLVDAIMSLTLAVEGWPEWMGPKIDPDDIEVTKTDSRYWAEGLCVATHDMTPDELRVSNKVNDSISSCARREAIARFIESEQAATGDEGQRVEEHAKALAAALINNRGTRTWDDLSGASRDVYRAAIRAGWTPPESEASE